MTSSSRQLAAIMFTDIVGYTALMGKDEARAMELVRKVREVQTPLIQKYSGSLLKEMGDGTLISFSTASDAIYCGLAIQKALSGDEELNLRAGIHLGEVTLENGDVYGDGVNIASRLQSIADPGGIYISDSVQKSIRGITDIQTVYLGELELKNVDYAVKTYAMRGEGLPRPRKTSEKHLTGRLWAEIRRRNVHRAALTYLAFAFILISIRPWVLEGYETILYIVLSVGLPISLFLSWRFERSPEGFISVTSRKSWENPFSDSEKKPFTSNTIVIGLLIVLIGLNVVPKFLRSQEGDFGLDGEKSIAVLAFRDMSPEGDQQYFGEGVAEEILNSLTRIPGLKVVARTSSFQFSDNTNLKDVGDQLGVNMVLEGSIRKQGDILRVTAQLINVNDGFHIWSEQFDGQSGDIFSIQEEIAQSIADKLKVAFETTNNVTDKGLSENSQAYDLYLQGRFYFNRRGPNLIIAQKYFEEAIALDPEFALAYTGLADTYLLIGFYGLKPPHEMMPKGKKAAENGISLNPLLAEAYNSLAFYYAFYEWNFEKGRSHFEKSLELNPNYIQAHLWYGLQLSWIDNDPDEAIKHGAVTISLDPLSHLAHGFSSIILISSEQFDKALMMAEKGVELDARSYLSQWAMGLAQIHLGDYESGIISFHNVEDISNRHHWAVAWEAWPQYEVNGYKAALPLLQELEERSESEFISPASKGIAAAVIGNMDLAFQYFYEAIDQRDPIILGLNTPFYPSTVREDSRYSDLVERIGLPK